MIREASQVADCAAPIKDEATFTMNSIGSTSSSTMPLNPPVEAIKGDVAECDAKPPKQQSKVQRRRSRSKSSCLPALERAAPQVVDTAVPTEVDNEKNTRRRARPVQHFLMDPRIYFIHFAEVVDCRNFNLKTLERQLRPMRSSTKGVP